MWEKIKMNELIAFLIPFLIAVESGGNDKVIGDDGKAFGCLQIHEICVKDVNRIYKTVYTHLDCFDRQKSIEICKLYLSYWGKRYEKRTKKKVTLEVLARIWNGGPRGDEKAITKKYWLKVEKVISDYTRDDANKEIK